MSRRARLIACAAVAGAAIACGLPSREEYASGTRVDDGGLADRGALLPDAFIPIASPNPGAEGGTDAADAGPPIVNLMPPNGATFEGGNCDPAGQYRSTTTGDSLARTGIGSCRVCRKGQDGFFTMDTYFLEPGPAGAGTYHARVWVRRPPGATQSFAVKVYLRSGRADYSELDIASGPEVTVTDEWQPVVADLVVKQPVPHMDTFLGGTPEPGSAPCFLVDDYEVWRTD